MVNRFGGNCFGCHIQARPQWDLVCEMDHGCAPIPLTRAMSAASYDTACIFVRVNERLETTAPEVWALGECFPGIPGGGS